MDEFGYLRFRGTVPTARGTYPGVFGLVNGLARDGLLTAEQERFRRDADAWYEANVIDPSTVDRSVYDRAVNPSAAAWFKPTAAPMLERLDGYLRLLDAHGIGWELVRSADPGRVVYEDEHQIVVVPHG